MWTTFAQLVMRLLHFVEQMSCGAQVVDRLEAESTSTARERGEQHASALAALQASHTAALAEARSSQQRLAAKHREAAAALEAAHERADATDAQVGASCCLPSMRGLARLPCLVSNCFKYHP